MAGYLIAFAKALLFGVVSLSAMVSIYAATNAVAVYSDHSVFVSGLMMVAAAAAANPLFCFIANYGLVRYSDLPVGLSLALTLPASLAWCVLAARGLLGALAR